MLLRGLPVYWLYWLNLRQYTLNLYSKGELCRFSINKSPALRTLCGPVSIQVCQCGTWKLWGRWSIWTNNSANIDFSDLKVSFEKFRFYILSEFYNVHCLLFNFSKVLHCLKYFKFSFPNILSFGTYFRLHHRIMTSLSHDE